MGGQGLAEERASGDGLARLLDTASDGVITLDAAGRIRKWSAAAERTFGWGAAEALGAEAADLLLAAGARGALRGCVDRLLSAGDGAAVEIVELDGVRRDRSEVPVELALTRVERSGGARIAAVARDLSERKQQESARRRFEAIVACSGDAILSGRLDGTIESWNRGAERLYGYTAEEMIGSNVARLRPEGNLDDVGDAAAAVRRGEPVYLETRERRKDGTLVDVAVTLSPLRDDAGEVSGLVSVIRDVTSRNEAAAQLAEANSRAAGAFQAAAIGMALIDRDGKILAVNPALCSLLQREEEDLLGTPLRELTHPDDVIQQGDRFARAAAGELDTYRVAERYLLPGGGIVWVSRTMTVSRNDDGTPVYLVAQIQDITDRKTAETELRRYADRLDAVSDQDPLTGLANRRAFEAAVEDELRVQRASGTPFSVLVLRLPGDEAAVVSGGEAAVRANRGADVIAHLGDGEFAVLLTGVDETAAERIRQRNMDVLAGYPGASCTCATVRAGDDLESLLRRARSPHEQSEAGAVAGREPVVPSGVRRLLEIARRQLEMPVSFLTRLDGENYVFERFSGDHAAFGVSEGDAMPLAGTHCQRMLDGRIDSVVGDLAAEPATRELDVTKALGLRAYVGVPVRLRDGEVYGTLCAVDTRPRPDLSRRQQELLSFLSELAAGLIEDEAERERARRLETSASGVRTLLIALEARDFYTGEHSKQVVRLATQVARRLGLDEEEIRDVEQVALLHDIGKVGIPDAILQKQGPLDEQEWQLMRQHPVVGERIISGTPGLTHLAPAMRAEHERWDGRGYPDGLRGEEIPLASRITLACDALEAMTSDRPYRPALTHARAHEELRACAGSQFDPAVVAALLDVVAAVSEPAVA